MLHGEHSAGASHTGLNFVSDKQYSVVTAYFYQFGEIFRGWGYKTAFTGNWLCNNRGSFFGGHMTDEKFFQMIRTGYITTRVLETEGTAITVSKRHSVNFRRKRTEAELIGLDLAGEAHCQERATVITVFKGDDRRSFGIIPGNFDCVFNRLGSTVYEKGRFRKSTGRYGTQLLSQCYNRLIR